jgi:hypothetical protein
LEECNLKRILIALLIIMCINVHAVADMIFNDGGVHNIDYNAGDVSVWDGPSGPTTINLLSGGAMEGHAHENSRINMYSGSLIQDWIMRDTSQMNIYDGNVVMAVDLLDSSQMNTYGGSLGAIEAFGTTEVSVYDCSIRVYLYASGASRIDIYDASIEGEFGLELETNFFGQIYIYGADFNYPYGPIPDVTGTVSGTLSSGDAFSWDFHRMTDSSNIWLVQHNLVPAPCAVILGSLGLTFSGWLLRRCRML